MLNRGNNMDSLSIDVKIDWTPIQQGGKKTIPINIKYYVITQPMKGKSGDISSWSLVLNVQSCELLEPDQRVGFGKAYFLVEDAPSFLLEKGFTMNIYEGSKLVGKAEVL
jgi:hypothetical protein